MSSTRRPAARAGRPRARTSRSRWRTWLRRLGWVAAGVFVLGLAAVAVAFARIDPPSPNALAEAQTSIVYYSDGTTELARIAEQNRESVPLAQVPKHVRDAVIAAEDRDFYSNSGVSPTGIARSVWQALRGADVQGGGSTITQQYVKNYFLTQDRTVDRKLREMVIAIKIDRDQSKEQILEGYLNTIYYGRGAYGIQTAAKAYFGKDVSQLTVAEGAVLASVINAPSLFDPALGERQQSNLANRFGYVLDGMVGQGWLSAADRAKATLPAIQAKAPSRVLTGPGGYIVTATRKELTSRLKLTDEQIDTGGLRITTTIDKKAQDAAVASVTKNMPTKGKVDGLYAGLVSVRPGDGAVVALYGGADYQARQFSSATDATIQAGSTFKAFALIAALQQGISTRTTFDGNSPLRDPALGSDFSVRNSGGVSYGTVDLRKATASSINTAFIRLNLRIGPQATRAAAVAAGIPENTAGLGTDLTNVLGTASPKVIDIANAYATIAAEGRRATPYLVRRVTSPAIDIDYQARPNVVDAFSREVAADTIDALSQVTAPGGTASRAAQLGRPAAGKTGTTDKSMSVWFTGFTPQLSTAVAMFKDVNGVPQPLDDIAGLDSLTGNSFPLSMWLDYMRVATDGLPKVDFPARAGIGDDRAPQQPTGPPASSTSEPSATDAPTATAAPTSAAPPTTTAPAPTTAAPTQTAPTTTGPKPTRHTGPPTKTNPVP